VNGLLWMNYTLCVPAWQSTVRKVTYGAWRTLETRVQVNGFLPTQLTRTVKGRANANPISSTTPAFIVITLLLPPRELRLTPFATAQIHHHTNIRLLRTPPHPQSTLLLSRTMNIAASSHHRKTLPRCVL
jgi:hypothetical protein